MERSFYFCHRINPQREMPMKSFLPKLMPLLAAAVLTACGGGTSPSDFDAPPARGTVITGLLAGHVTKAQVDAGTTSTGIQALTGTAKCDVDVRYVLYMTRDPAGNPATASAGVLVPSGTAAPCTGSVPAVLYAHGTSLNQANNMADVAHNSEAALQMAMYAAQGFIVVMPNYLGYDRSSLQWHPYLNAEAQAIDMVDGLRAAYKHLGDAAATTTPSGKLFVTGYSQGGHVAMATHRALERDYASEFTVTASGNMSGPYNLAGFTDYVVNQQANAGAVLFANMLVTSYQHSYGNVYTQPADIYNASYAATADALLPSASTVTDLMTGGKLPADPTFTNLFGTGGLFLPAFKTAYATSGYRTDLQTNTLLGWTPKRPISLCGGASDPTVFYAANTTVAKADFLSRNVTATTFDLENATTVPTTIYGGFQQAKTAAGTNVQAQYHGTLVPPFCTALERGYFQQVLQAGL
jgi:hypothetical protein